MDLLSRFKSWPYKGDEHLFRSVRELLLISLCITICAVFLQGLVTPAYVLREMQYLGAPYYDLKGIAKSAVYIVSYAISLGVLIVSVLVKKRWISLLLFVFISIAYLIDLSLQFIAGEKGFTSFHYVVGVNEAGNYKNLFVFSSQILYGISGSLVVMALLVFCRKATRLRISSWFVLLLPFFYVPVVAAKMAVFYVSYPSYPAPIKIPIIIANHHLKSVPNKPRVLEEQIISAGRNRENIVLIIDESIGGYYLSINGFEKDTTPYLKTLQENKILKNFGVVNSVANCSAITQLMLRIGLGTSTDGRGRTFVEQVQSLPTIYQFAKRAGYVTALIDSQNRTDQGGLQNYLTYEDLKYVDHYLTHSSRVKEYERDYLAIDKLKQVLNDDKTAPKFVVLVKDGAHWPYLWRVPVDRHQYLPIQVAEYDPMVAANKERILNTYLNLVKYTVDDFFVLYTKALDGFDVLTFYTSDHGQSFFESGAKDTLTHCSTYEGLPSSQVAVPLFVLDPSRSGKYSYDQGKAYAQHQIFPSVLEEMGFSESVRAMYGNTLAVGDMLGQSFDFFWSLEGDKSSFRSNDACVAVQGADRCQSLAVAD